MAMDYRIGSFNIQKLGRNSMKRKDLLNVAEIIKSNQLDIVAIQEISSKEALCEIMKCLDGYIVNEGVSSTSNARDSYAFETNNWESRWAKPISSIGGKGAEEGYAFIWSKKYIELPKNKYGYSSEPDIYLKSKEVIRPPFYGRFIVKNCNAEIRLINTHIIFRKTPNEDAEFEEENSSSDDYMERINEYKVLASEIYRRIYTDNIGTRQILTFILGDYNLCLQGSESSDMRAVMPSEVSYLEYDGHAIKTIQNQKTTIKGKSRSNPDIVYSGEDNLANNYDHFSYEERLENSIGINSKRIDAEKVYIGSYQNIQDNNGNAARNEYEAYRMIISDHLPIMMTISIAKSQNNQYGDVRLTQRKLLNII